MGEQKQNVPNGTETHESPSQGKSTRGVCMDQIEECELPVNLRLSRKNPRERIESGRRQGRRPDFLVQSRSNSVSRTKSSACQSNPRRYVRNSVKSMIAVSRLTPAVAKIIL